MPEKPNFSIIAIEELIRYRRRTERLVSRSAVADFPTEAGRFKIIGYEVKFEAEEPFALVMGDLSRAKSPMVRMHSSCFTGDVLESLRCECGDQLKMAMQMIANEGVGAVVASDWAESDPTESRGAPGCHISTGLLAELLTRAVGQPVAVMEVDCRSQGNDACRFVFGSPVTLLHVHKELAQTGNLEDALSAL